MLFIAESVTNVADPLVPVCSGISVVCAFHQFTSFFPFPKRNGVCEGSSEGGREGGPSSRSGKVHLKWIFCNTWLHPCRGLIIYLPGKRCITRMHVRAYAAALKVEGESDGGAPWESALFVLFFCRMIAAPPDDVSSFLLLPASPAAVSLCSCAETRSPERSQRPLSSAGPAKLPAGTGSPSMRGMCVRRAPTHRREH